MTSRRDDAERHVEAFNEAVRSGGFEAFVATFAPDAVMRFAGVPVGPFEGRAAILEAYRARPPDDTMLAEAVTEVDPDAVLVRFAWSAGGTGTMRLRWTDAGLRELEVAFDR